MSLSRVRERDGISYFTIMTLQWAIGARQYKSVYTWSRGAVRGAPPFWS
jgi:hypothetical protein